MDIKKYFGFGKNLVREEVNRGSLRFFLFGFLFYISSFVYVGIKYNMLSIFIFSVIFELILIFSIFIDGLFFFKPNIKNGILIKLHSIVLNIYTKLEKIFWKNPKKKINFKSSMKYLGFVSIMFLLPFLFFISTLSLNWSFSPTLVSKMQYSQGIDTYDLKGDIFLKRGINDFGLDILSEIFNFKNDGNMYDVCFHWKLSEDSKLKVVLLNKTYEGVNNLCIDVSNNNTVIPFHLTETAFSPDIDADEFIYDSYPFKFDMDWFQFSKHFFRLLIAWWAVAFLAWSVIEKYLKFSKDIS